MLYFFNGTDREKVRSEMDKALAKVAKKAQIVRISDANAVADFKTALLGSGMFGEKQTVVLDNVSANGEMREILFDQLEQLEKSDEHFFILEGKLDAATRKTIEKHAETAERFDLKKTVHRGDIFVLAHAMSQGDKKKMWVEYQRALQSGEAPEAIHGVLFWGAKNMFMKLGERDHPRAAKLVAKLAELPHEARRRGFELEYALEHFLLSQA